VYLLQKGVDPCQQLGNGMWFKNPLLLFSSFVSVMKSHISILILVYGCVCSSHGAGWILGRWVGL
jgi:hypothetical protein